MLAEAFSSEWPRSTLSTCLSEESDGDHSIWFSDLEDTEEMSETASTKEEEERGMEWKLTIWTDNMTKAGFIQIMRAKTTSGTVHAVAVS